jgi:hypothetical protein
MTDFLKDCYFNGFCKGRKNVVPTPRYAKKLRTMPHSRFSFLKKSFICDSMLCNSMWNSSQKFSGRLCAMRHSAESIFIVEYLREFESICKIVLTHESGGPGVQFNEKTEGRNSRETVPLRNNQKPPKLDDIIPLNSFEMGGLWKRRDEGGKFGCKVPNTSWDNLKLSVFPIWRNGPSQQAFPGIFAWNVAFHVYKAYLVLMLAILYK